MDKAYNNDRHTCRISPCPDYDIGAMQEWLTDMAAQGWLFEKFLPLTRVALFTCAAPCQAVYALRPVQTKSFWSALFSKSPGPADSSAPVPACWERAAESGAFYVYRSLDPAAAENEPLPPLKASDLDTARKSYRPNVVLSLITLLCFFYNYYTTSPLSTAAWDGWRGNFSLLLPVLLPLLAAVVTIGQLRGYFFIGRLQNTLKEGRAIPKSDWRERRAAHLAAEGVSAFLIAALLFALVMMISSITADYVYVPLEEYGKDLPFATLRDYGAALGEDYRMEASDPADPNQVHETGNLLTPRYIYYSETAAFQTAGGRTVHRHMSVNYYRMRGELLARALVRELREADSAYASYVALDASSLGADEAIGWEGDYSTPTVILRRGNLVVEASFYNILSTDDVAFGEWTRILSDSLEATAGEDSLPPALRG